MMRQPIEQRGGHFGVTKHALDLLRKSGEFFVMKEDLDDQTEAANEGI